MMVGFPVFWSRESTRLQSVGERRLDYLIGRIHTVAAVVAER